MQLGVGDGHRISLLPKNALHKPTVWRAALAKNPQPHAMDIDGRVVIARDLPTIPPTGLDAFWLPEQTQRATTPRQSASLGQKLRSRQQPQGTAETRPRGVTPLGAGQSLAFCS